MDFWSFTVCLVFGTIQNCMNIKKGHQLGDLLSGYVILFNNLFRHGSLRIGNR